ncbi:hypothetical protein C8R44DRAFT_977567 [Mycena epipterygia]|nr:hypothetical protein C8R44DRAFT_977567 [Mycena epipterygia]
MFVRNVASVLSASISLSLFANAQLAGQTVKFETVLTAGNGNCLTATSNADGAAVIIKDCGTNATALNSCVVPNSESVVAPLKIFGDKIQIWDCDQQNDNQKWNADAVNLPTSYDFRITQRTSLTAPSPGSAAQTWSDPSHSGQVVIYDNLCMSPAANVNDGVKIILSPCVPGNAAQGWSHETGIINNHNLPKECLDLTDGVETPGNQACDLLVGTGDNTNQDWIVTDTF